MVFAPYVLSMFLFCMKVFSPENSCKIRVPGFGSLLYNPDFRTSIFKNEGPSGSFSTNEGFNCLQSNMVALVNSSLKIHSYIDSRFLKRSGLFPCLVSTGPKDQSPDFEDNILMFKHFFLSTSHLCCSESVEVPIVCWGSSMIKGYSTHCPWGL